VKVRDTWVSHQLVGKPALVPINTIEVQPGRAGSSTRSAADTPEPGTSRRAARSSWSTSAPPREPGSTRSNLALIEIVRHLLGISTPLLTMAPPSHSNVDRFIEQVSAVGGTQYLSGTGGLAYMGEDAPACFRDAGIELVWSNHAMTTGDSIVTVLMDHGDPMATVLARH